jgi:hypothetical protein
MLWYGMQCCKSSRPTGNPLNKKLCNWYLCKRDDRGKLTGIDDALDQNAKFGLLRSKHIENYGKPEIMDYFKLNQGVQQNCITRIDTFENNADMALVKVDMRYNNFVRSNYITMVNTASGWKITNVYSVVK